MKREQSQKARQQKARQQKLRRRKKNLRCSQDDKDIKRQTGIRRMGDTAAKECDENTDAAVGGLVAHVHAARSSPPESAK